MTDKPFEFKFDPNIFQFSTNFENLENELEASNTIESEASNGIVENKPETPDEIRENEPVEHKPEAPGLVPNDIFQPIQMLENKGDLHHEMPTIEQIRVSQELEVKAPRVNLSHLPRLFCFWLALTRKLMLTILCIHWRRRVVLLDPEHQRISLTDMKRNLEAAFAQLDHHEDRMRQLLAKKDKQEIVCNFIETYAILGFLQFLDSYVRRRLDNIQHRLQRVCQQVAEGYIELLTENLTEYDIYVTPGAYDPKEYQEFY